MQTVVHDTIGFIGAGLMGHGMASCLLNAGYPVSVVSHRSRGSIMDLLQQGASEASSLQELAETSSIVFLCLPNAAVIEAVIQEISGHLRPHTIIVDCSTSDPTVTQRLAEKLSVQGVDYCDAPLGGTPAQAEAGKLHLMVGANEALFARLKPVFSVLAEKVVHVGRVADGHRMKLINNFLSLGYGALYAEALAIARKSGLTVEQVDQVIRGGRMDCGFYRTFMDYALNGQRDSHKFTLTNACKDMRYVESMANAAGCATPMTSAVKNAYAMAVAMGGHGPNDYIPHLPDFALRWNGMII